MWEKTLRANHTNLDQQWFRPQRERKTSLLLDLSHGSSMSKTSTVLFVYYNQWGQKWIMKSINLSEKIKFNCFVKHFSKGGHCMLGGYRGAFLRSTKAFQNWDVKVRRPFGNKVIEFSGVSLAMNKKAFSMRIQCFHSF